MSEIVSTFFFFNETATTEIYTLSLHDALPILLALAAQLPADQVYEHTHAVQAGDVVRTPGGRITAEHVVVASHYPFPDRSDRKSTRLNSSHANISYAVFCLKQKTTHPSRYRTR